MKGRGFGHCNRPFFVQGEPAPDSNDWHRASLFVTGSTTTAQMTVSAVCRAHRQKQRGDTARDQCGQTDVIGCDHGNF